MTNGHCFISYSGADGLDFATQLADELQGQHPFIKVWFDKRELSSSSPGDWDDQIADAIKACKCLVFVMTEDSTAEGSVCKDEWTWALKYKKPVITLRKDKKAAVPFRLNNRQHVDFLKSFDIGIAQLRTAIARLDSPEGVLEELRHRLADAQRDFRRAKGEDQLRIQADIDELKKQIETQQEVVNNPEAAAERTQKNIEAGLERERQPDKPIAAKTSTKFINPPPGIAPNYFQDRIVETQQLFDFLANDYQRLMTVVGRGGVGKTTMVCRLLKGLETGQLPDKLGPIKVDGIVYLSENGSHRINFANIYSDLCKLLSIEIAQELDTIYKNPQISTESKMRALLERFSGDQVVLLLDNFEPLVDTETFDIRDTELNEALRAFLNGAHTTVKIVITTRAAPRPLNLVQPGRQRVLILDEGLDSPYAENILREMDRDGHIGLQSASDALLLRARERTRGYPRALEALFAILASDRYTTLEELLSKPTPENVVQELVGEAFNRLDLNAQKVMQALAVYNRPVSPAAVDYLLAPFFPTMDSAPILQRLANMHFARKEGGQFYLHPVDREFAFNLIPEGNFFDILRSSGGLTLYDYLVTVLNDYPDLLENEDTYHQAMQDDDKDLVTDLVAAYKNLDRSLIKKLEKDAFQDESLLSILDRSLQVPQLWTQFALTTCAADYFARARKPRASWKKLDDLAPQLAEFDLRCAAGDYDTAARVLVEIDFDYLLLWGYYRLIIQMHENIAGKIPDPLLQMANLNGLGLAYQGIGHTRQSSLYFEQGIMLAQERGDYDWEGTFLCNLGNMYLDLGESHQAIQFYEEALAIARETRDRRSEGMSLGNLGRPYMALGNFRRAIEFYEQALAIAREIGDRRTERAYLGSLGEAYAALGDSRKATQYYEQASSVGHETGDSSEGLKRGDLRGAYTNLGNSRIQFYEQALSIAREAGDRRSEGAHLSNLGWAYAVTGSSSKAIEFYEQALAIARDTEDKFSEGISLGNLGGAYAAWGDSRKAIQFYEQALSIARETGNRLREGIYLGNLGGAYATLGNSREAIEFYEQALAIARETGDKFSEGIHLGSLGGAYDALGDSSKAIQFREQALAIARETGDRSGEGAHLGSLGNAYLFLGDVRKAIEFYEQALSIAREVGDKRSEGSWLGDLGCYAELGETDKALEYHTMALAISRETEDRIAESIWLGNIGHDLRDINDFEQAIQSYQQSIQIGDELGYTITQSYERWGLAQVYLFQDDLQNAFSTIEAALQYDVPENNHSATALHGIIALRRGDTSAARRSFTGAVAQADKILAQTPNFLSALDAKGLALSGLAICEGKQHILPAIEAFRAARKIAPHAGTIKRVLRLFDELVKGDKEGILKEVRKAVEGKDL